VTLLSDGICCQEGNGFDTFVESDCPRCLR
jgi:hypothetical protein